MTDSGGGGPSDYAVMAETRNEARQEEGGGQQGFTSLGAAFSGGGLTTGGPGSSGTESGQMAYARGQQIGAATVNALSEARNRITEAAARQSMADTLPQFFASTGLLDPVKDAPVIENYRQQILAGTPPQQIMAELKEKGDETARQTLGNPNAKQEDREAAAARLGYAGELPKATGTAGSFETPLRGPGQNPVTVSPQQSAMNQSLVTERGAQASAAGTRASMPEGLKPGNRWAQDENGVVKLDANGQPVQEPNPGAGTNAVARRYVNTVVSSAASIAREADNISHLGYDTSTGAQQIGGTHTGILNTITNNLGKTLSTTEQQEYKTTISNLTRMVANIEQNGTGRVNQAFIDKLSSLENTPGNTEMSRLYNLAQIRQAIEAQHDALVANPDATRQSVTAYEKALASVQKSIPWTASDVINFQRSGGSQTLGAFLDKHGVNENGEPKNPLAPVQRPGATGAVTPPPSGKDPLGLGL